ncbi:MAG: Response regulator [Parcubacteria group bacterium GW2011_GWC1_45_9]|nr:MAG: Response regulator [Parcubacteria group bacterium GW2011_GWA1_Parcubacteria_45_10]KKT89155.1 MAG: Response regulator [Parcubacteria group bacterium GW2011_GWB1_45_10]KKU17349.1 MAG: Response regulator [Parcubacteria group bacterium GW2011_GWC1_45_9]HCI05254.1 hypothetical protein [Patescibacteria group bacterium]
MTKNPEKISRVILVIEDDEPTREAILWKLNKSGYQGDSAGDGIAGLEMLKQKQYSGVLLDLRMPRGDGYYFMEEKNKDQELKKVPVIVFSNFSQPEFVNRSLELGAKGYLVKAQHSVDQIVEELTNCLENGICSIDR